MATVIDAADIKDYADEYCRMHKDAARYRWLRDKRKSDLLHFNLMTIRQAHQWDAAIDREIENANS